MALVQPYESDTTNWHYLNEGNCHLVVATNSRKVLRLLKGPPGARAGLQKNDVSIITLRAVHFVNKIMVPLICGSNNDPLQVVQLSERFVNDLNRELFSMRPVERRHKEIESQYAVLAPNYTLPFPVDEESFVYCVEIKCKQGWMNPYLKPYGKCKFCLKQYFKLSEGVTDSISHYCPLDLFSGEKDRMKQAIIGLLLSPQNNFKMFRNGSIIYGEKSTLEDMKKILAEVAYFHNNLNTFLEFLVGVLLDNHSEVIDCDTPSNISTRFRENLQKALARQSCNDYKLQLPLDCILDKILKIQLLEADITLDEMKKCNEYDYIASLLSCADKHPINNNQSTFLEHIDPIQKHMLSAVARDCSIMIGFSHRRDIVKYDGRIIEVGDAKVAYNIGVTDLEPKSASVINKQKKSQSLNLELYLNKTIRSSDA